MARYTDTRNKVRALADEAFARGEEPSPTAILRALGRGSASTVVDELKRWRRARDTARPSVAATEADSPLATELVAQVRDALDTLGQRVEAAHTHRSEQEALALERLTAVQRMALMSIEEAREQARFWKQAAQQARDDAGVKADAYRQAMLAAQSEARRLAERVRELESALASAQGVANTRARLTAARAGSTLGAALGVVDAAARRLTAGQPRSVCLADPDGPTE